MFDSQALCRVLFDELALAPNAEFVVAYSGGCDSHVLLHAMRAARHACDGAFDFTVRALHFDHALAPQSADWARRCDTVCRHWEIPFAATRQGPIEQRGASPEALARQNRYRWFEQALGRQEILLTAHHANDQAETILLKLLRGGAVEALAGIPAIRVLSAPQSTRVARPLLAFSRHDLTDYAHRHGLSWIEDPSNQSLQFDRNFIRHSIIPALAQRWPGALVSMGSAANNCRETAAFLEQVVDARLQDCQVAARKGVFCLAPPLDARALKQADRFQTISMLRRWIHQHGQPSPSSGQLATLFQQMFEANSDSAGVQWQHAELRCFDHRLHLIKRLHNSAGETIEWDLKSRNLNQNDLRIEVHHGPNESNHALDPDRLKGKSLKLVWRQGGERMTLPGRAHNSALKKLFQQHAVPPWERDALPLLLADNALAWAPGIGPSSACHANNKPGIHLRFVVHERSH